MYLYHMGHIKSGLKPNWNFIFMFMETRARADIFQVVNLIHESIDDSLFYNSLKSKVSTSVFNKSNTGYIIYWECIIVDPGSELLKCSHYGNSTVFYRRDCCCRIWNYNMLSLITLNNFTYSAFIENPSGYSMSMTLSLSVVMLGEGSRGLIATQISQSLEAGFMADSDSVVLNFIAIGFV